MVTLGRWLVDAQCRLVALLGMGGIGKSFLAARLAEGMIGSFECLIWRSLRNAPPLETLLGELVPFVSQQQDVQPTIDRLMHWLIHRRCLLILDNVETVMQPGDRVGLYQPGYEGYGDLLRRVGETMHQSCVVLTSREKPLEVSLLEEPEGKVRSLALLGSRTTALALLAARGLSGSEADKNHLCEFYACSPLALKIVAASIQTLFEGSIAAFLAEETMVFNGLRRLLDQQFERLSDLEQTIMTWLAVNREWTDLATLQQDLVPSVPRSDLLESLESLVWRSLVEQQQCRYTQQPVVMEYVTSRLIQQVAAELEQGRWDTCDRVALVKTTLQDYIRHSQERVIVRPVLGQLAAAIGSRDRVGAHLESLLAQLQRVPTDGYSGGNLFNLLAHHRPQITDLDLAGLTLRHANLQRLTLHRVKFTGARFVSPVFTHTISSIFAVAFSPSSAAFATDSSLVALGESSGDIHLWRTDDTQPLLSLGGHDNRVLAVTFSPDGRRLASASADGTVKLWELPSGRLLANLGGHGNGVCSVSFSADGSRLASASMDGTIRLWNAETHQCDRILTEHRDWVWAVAFAPQGRTLASGSADTTLKLWDTDTGEVLSTLKGHDDRLWSVSFSPDGTRLASASEDRTVKLWDVATGALLHTLAGHNSIVWSVSFSADGSRLASGSGGSVVKLREASTGRVVRRLEGHSAWVRSVKFSRDGTLLASGSADCTVRVWEVATGALLHTLTGHDSWIWEVSFSMPQASNADLTLASSSTDRTVKLWDVATGQLLCTLEGHTGEVWAVRYSPNGPLLASSSADETIRLWNTDTGECLRVLRGDRPYEGMDITGAIGLTDAQQLTLKALGAVTAS